MDEYPLPSFVMLEFERIDFGIQFKVSLIDKKHNEILDCNYCGSIDFRSSDNDLKYFIDDFKQDLRDNGVI